MDKLEEHELRELARSARRLIIEAIHNAGTGHAGSSLSTVEMLTYLYHRHLRIDPVDPLSADRDRLVFSKGHGAPALYAVLALRGYFQPQLLSTLRAFGSPLQGHPFAGVLPGIDQSTGSLGQGISCALGMAIGLRMRKCPARVYAVLGDGELQEGQNWEAFMAAAHYRVGNLVAIVDYNRLQNDGTIEEVMSLGDIATKLTAFGWTVAEVDGHNFPDIARGLSAAAEGQPHFIVAHTVKGRGVSYMENVLQWHHHPISDADREIAMHELEGPA